MAIATTLDDTLGAILLGTIGSAILFGMNTVQSYYYSRHAIRDKLSLRLLIGILWLLNATQLVFVLRTVYHYSVTKYGDASSLITPDWSLICNVILSCIIFILVTGVYSWRIYIISSRNLIIALIPMLLSLLTAAFGFNIAANGFLSRSYALENHHRGMLEATYLSAMVCDIYIATILSYYLLRGLSGLRETKSVIHTLVLYCVTTGVLAAIAHACTLILYLTMPRNFIYIGIFIVTPELYTNALLATLNARKNLRNRTSGIVSDGNPIALQSNLHSRMSEEHSNPPLTPVSRSRPRSTFETESSRYSTYDFRRQSLPGLQQHPTASSTPSISFSTLDALHNIPAICSLEDEEVQRYPIQRGSSSDLGMIPIGLSSQIFSDVSKI